MNCLGRQGGGGTLPETVCVRWRGTKVFLLVAWNSSEAQPITTLAPYVLKPHTCLVQKSVFLPTFLPVLNSQQGAPPLNLKTGDLVQYFSAEQYFCFTSDRMKNEIRFFFSESEPLSTFIVSLQVRPSGSSPNNL